MQEWCCDYYSDEFFENRGCCLKCSKSYDGCLCFDCVCKNCYWYSPGITKGSCDMVPILKEEGKKRMAEYYKQKEKEKHKLGLLLKKQNKELIEKIKSKNEIVNIYTCQNCRREFVSEKEHRIEKNKIPLCDICLGKIKLKEGEDAD